MEIIRQMMSTIAQSIDSIAHSISESTCGVNIVSSYVIWIHHEEIENQYDFTGNKDLRRFVRTCEKCGLYMFLRIGPWSHAEARNGGFPDWLVKKHNENIRTKFEVEVYPLFKAADIYLEHTPTFDDSMICELTSAAAVCEYVFDIEI